jgi:hypothetical protein
MDITADCHRTLDVQQVRLLPQHLCSLPDNEEGLVFSQAPLSVQVVLQEGDVGFGRIGFGVELRVGWEGHGGGLDLGNREGWRRIRGGSEGERGVGRTAEIREVG